MFKKLVLILVTAVIAGPALAAQMSDPNGDPYYVPTAECECQRYGICQLPEPPPPRP